MGSGKPISAASGARIQYPANRVAPLSTIVSEEEYYKNFEVTEPVGELCVNSQGIYSQFASSAILHGRMPFKKQRSHSLTPIDMNQHGNHEKSASADGVIQQNTTNFKNNKTFTNETNSNSNNWDANVPTSPPAKPARYDGPKAEERRLELQRLYHVSGSDSGNGSGDSTQSSAHSDPNKCRSDTDYNIVMPTIKHQFDYDLAEEKLLQSDNNFEYFVESKINLDTFESKLIPVGVTKPLESDTLHTIKLLLRTSGPRILANHMTKMDSQFLLNEAIQIEGLDIKTSCLELCFLPQGRQLRLDIIERL